MCRLSSTRSLALQGTRSPDYRNRNSSNALPLRSSQTAQATYRSDLKEYLPAQRTLYARTNLWYAQPSSWWPSKSLDLRPPNRWRLYYSYVPPRRRHNSPHCMPPVERSYRDQGLSRMLIWWVLWPHVPENPFPELYALHTELAESEGNNPRTASWPQDSLVTDWYASETNFLLRGIEALSDLRRSAPYEVKLRADRWRYCDMRGSKMLPHKSTTFSYRL